MNLFSSGAASSVEVGSVFEDDNASPDFLCNFQAFFSRLIFAHFPSPPPPRFITQPSSNTISLAERRERERGRGVVCPKAIKKQERENERERERERAA